MEPIFLPIPDACRVLGVGRSKLYELIAVGDISIRKIGRKTLVPCEELTSFAARLAGGGGSKTEAA
jgi:excisionase family DNA binding protein